MNIQKKQFYPIAPITDFVLSEHANNLYKQEAKSSLALAKSMADKLNEVIAAFNELGKNKWEKIHEQDGKIRSAILYMKDNLINTMNDLMNMLLRSGFIDTRIQVHIKNLVERVDNLVGSITEDSEVIDGRLGYNSTQYSSLGNAIRGQFNDIAYKIDDLKKELNLFAIESHNGYVTVSEDNKVTYSNLDTYKCLHTELITCREGEQYLYKGNSVNAVAGWIFFNNGSVIGSGNTESHDVATQIVTIPEGCTHVMFSSFVDKSSDREFTLEVSYLGSNKVSDKLFNHLGEICKVINYYPTTYQTGYLTSNLKYSKDTSIHSKTTGLIPCKQGEKYAYYGVGRGLSVCWVFYDITGKNVVSSGNNSSYSATETIVEIPENVYYVQFSSFSNTTSEVILSVRYITEDEVVVSANPVLVGKKYVACGDSFTAGDFTDSLTNDYIITIGKYKGYKKVYPYLIGNRNNMNVINESVNGSTLANVSGKNPLCLNRLTAIPLDADYVTIKIGINDSHSGVAIGTISDSTDTTFYGAWNKVLKYLTTNLPYAKIGIIVTNGATIEYVNATIEVAKKWGIPYINLATDETLPVMLRTNRTDVCEEMIVNRNKAFSVNYDNGNTHPNEKAHEFESTIIENFLLRL